jgi:hypothetical protein
MDVKMGQMLKNTQRVGQKSVGHNKVGSKYQGKQSSYKSAQPDPQQLKETADEYNKYK